MSKKPTKKATVPAALDLGGGLAWSQVTMADGAEFWSVVGPLSSCRAVIKEMGGCPIYANERQAWICGRDGGGKVVAAASVAPSEKADGSFWLDYGYVAPAHRGHGIWRAMLAHRLALAAAAGGKSARCATATLSRPLEAAGFRITSQRGSWSYMEKSL